MMSKSRSPLSRGLRALGLLPLVCLAIGLQARTVYVPVDKDSEKNVSEEKPQGNPVVLNIRKDGTIESGGKVYTLSQLKDIIPPHAAGQPQTTVTILAADDVLMGAVDDVKNELRKLESLKVNYASASSREGITRYMPPLPENGKVRVAKTLDEMFQGVDRETILMIRINSAGAYMLGNRRVQDDAEIVRLGKAFLKEHGKETHFGLHHDRGTGYGAYTRIQTLLKQVYEEVRDEKAMEVYGKRLQDLSAEERAQINFLVPLSISEAETI